VETLGGRVSGLQGTVQRIKVTNGEVVEVVLIGDQITDAGLAHLAGLPSLQSLVLYKTEITAAGLVHFQKMPALRRLELAGPQTVSPRFTDSDIANLREALPNVRVHDGAPVAPPPPPPPPPQ